MRGVINNSRIRLGAEADRAEFVFCEKEILQKVRL